VTWIDELLEDAHRSRQHVNLDPDAIPVEQPKQTYVLGKDDASQAAIGDIIFIPRPERLRNAVRPPTPVPVRPHALLWWGIVLCSLAIVGIAVWFLSGVRFDW